MIALTGHTKGIGKALYEKSLPHCIGFSTSTGYDIRKKEDRARIIKESADCDIFINCAHNEYGQSLLLLDYFKEYHNTNKTIVNVGSRAAEDTYIIKSPEYFHFLDYQNQKRHLKNLCLDLQQTSVSLKVKYVWYGYVGTERILNKYPNLTEKDYISIAEAVNIIENQYV